MKYIILTADNHRGGAQQVADEVACFIANGWEPIGGVAVSITENENYGVRWAQAMVKRDADTAEKPEGR